MGWRWVSLASACCCRTWPSLQICQQMWKCHFFAQVENFNIKRGNQEKAGPFLNPVDGFCDDWCRWLGLLGQQQQADELSWCWARLTRSTCGPAFSDAGNPPASSHLFTLSSDYCIILPLRLSRFSVILQQMSKTISDSHKSFKMLYTFYYWLNGNAAFQLNQLFQRKNWDMRKKIAGQLF